jgi:2-polyprenyl-6-methoxyphenol hydroxylase-like FAD-dependent oxidoreductase
MNNSARENLLAGLPVTERRRHLAGVSTSVLEGGEGPPMVLLHGPGEFAATWLPVLPRLAGTHRVIVPDLPGHGASQVDKGPLDAERVLHWPFREFAANRGDIEGNYLATLGTVPAFADRLRGARRESRIVGMAVPNYFRKPYGPGWALVGDAGYNKDFITAQGIQDAFRDAELCVTALHQTFSGGRPFDSAMREYQAARDGAVLPMYEFTAELASLEPPPPEMQQLLAAVSGDQEAMDGFARVTAGVTSPAEFFSDENVARILGANLTRRP